MAEFTFSDFSGGMNAQAAVDKLQQNECLLAENIRLDESGNVQSAGAFTAQGSSLGDTHNITRIHSLYWNPSLGAVAGVGADVFTGQVLSTMSRALTGLNNSQIKQGFASAPGRVYFDVGLTGYWTDLSNILTVDWPPPTAVGATVTGPTAPGTCTQSSYGVGTVAWNNPNNAVGTNTTSPASVQLGPSVSISQYLEATMSTSSFGITSTAVTGVQVTCVASFSVLNSLGSGRIEAALIKNGTPVGATHFANITQAGVFNTYTFGNSADLWGLSLSQADVNAGNFGIQFVAVYAASAGPPTVVSLSNIAITVYQGSGFTAGTGTAGTLTGTYTYKVTFVAKNGEESDGSNPSNSVVLSAQQGTLTGLPLGDARTTARNVYRKGGALTSYYLIGTLVNGVTINDNLTTTYADNTSDLSALATGVILAGDVPGDYPNTRLGSQQVRYPVYHYDRVFWVSVAKPNQIIWSKPLNGFAYPTINFINVGDAKPISRLISIFGELIIVKTDSIWRLTGTDESSFDLSQTPSAVGTDESFAVHTLPDKIIFHNRWGFWVFNGYTSQPMTTKLDLWQRQEDRTNKSLFGFNGFHPPEVVSNTVPLGFEIVGNSEKFYLTYAERGVMQNNACLRFDLKLGNITKRSTVALSLVIDPVNGFVYQGDQNGFISLLDDFNGASANGLPVNFDFQHGYQDIERGSNKALWALEFYINTNGQTVTPFVYYDNGLANETLAPINTTVLQRVVRTMEGTQARKCQNWSFRLQGFVNPVNVAGVPQIQLVHVKALYDVRVGRARTGQT